MVGRKLPYYNQSTDFTCGPSSLMMAMTALDKSQAIDRAHELQLWREANTVFMGKGHPGSSPCRETRGGDGEIGEGATAGHR